MTRTLPLIVLSATLLGLVACSEVKATAPTLSSSALSSSSADSTANSSGGSSLAGSSSSVLSSSSATAPLGKPFALVRAMGVGMNLGNGLEAPAEGAWGVTAEDIYFQMMADSGFKNVRIPTRWDTHVSFATGGACVVDTDWMNRVDHVVKTAMASGLIVVLDAHHWEAMYSSPATEEACFNDVWKEIARHFAGVSNDSLVLELLNEPRDVLTTSLWNQVVARTIDTIRTIQPTRTLMVGSGNWYSYSALASLALPANDSNIIASFHYYNPFNFTHQGADFLGTSMPPVVTTWSATDPQKKQLRAEFDTVQAWATAHNRPVYLGEYGTYHLADTASRELWTEFVTNEAKARGWSTAYWEFCSGFGIYNPGAGNYNQYLVNALLHPSHSFAILNPYPNLDTLRYVVLDDFDSLTVDHVNLNQISWHRTLAKGLPIDSAKGYWYGFHNADSRFYKEDGTFLVTADLKNADSTITGPVENDKLIVPDGHTGRGIYVKMNLKGDGVMYPYVGIGTNLDNGDSFDLSTLKALTFWAKGRGDIKVGWQEKFTDTISENNWGKFRKEISLTADWTQYTIWFDEWLPSPYSALEAGGYQWAEHNTTAYGLQFENAQTYGQATDDTLEMWLDDIRLYGMDKSAFGY